MGKDLKLNAEQNKSLKIVSVLIGILGILSVLFGILKYFSTSETDEQKYMFNGLYQYDTYKLYIYQRDFDKIYYYIDAVSSFASINENSAEGRGVIYKYKFSLIDSNILFETTNDQIPSGTYTRIDDMSLEKFFEKEFGDYTLFDSEYNGFYESSIGNIYLFQTSDKEVMVILKGKNGVHNSKFTINGNRLEYQMGGTTFIITVDNEYKYFIFKTINDTQDSSAYSFDAKYVKTKNITIDDILNSYISLSS